MLLLGHNQDLQSRLANLVFRASRLHSATGALAIASACTAHEEDCGVSTSESLSTHGPRSCVSPIPSLLLRHAPHACAHAGLMQLRSLASYASSVKPGHAALKGTGDSVRPSWFDVPATTPSETAPLKAPAPHVSTIERKSRQSQRGEKHEWQKTTTDHSDKMLTIKIKGLATLEELRELVQSR